MILKIKVLKFVVVHVKCNLRFIQTQNLNHLQSNENHKIWIEKSETKIKNEKTCGSIHQQKEKRSNHASTTHGDSFMPSSFVIEIWRDVTLSLSHNYFGLIISPSFVLLWSQKNGYTLFKYNYT
ncbi:hypothetical protein Lalb_Chr21g0315661 [Lupinus albus]|uniref:Uncharacterized protein n=1 Tax=Lupinus albus TaxID=3870 RepID=A0A6A4NMI0_LUPAL|nr:hypothetical protein Lalb_Chr21g0315661 [Lupinus albus]